MFKQLDNILDPGEISQLHSIIASAQFVDGRISNPHSKVKNNMHLDDAEAYKRSSQILMNALSRNEDFHNFAQPKRVAPPLVTRYQKGMQYGLHYDAANVSVADKPLRSDLSCTIFLSEPESYEGGALNIVLGDTNLRFKCPAGSAVVYPSTTLHEVEKVESGERIVGLTFIESCVADTSKRELLYELGEVAALEGNNMSYMNYTRIRSVQQNLIRRWATN